MSGVSAASRIVVKIGSSSLTREDGGLDLNRIDSVARLVARWRGADREVVIVSSGAVAAGLDPLGFTSKPKDLPSVQAAAAMGQGLLMARWTAAFQAHHLDAAQVLLTTDDVMRRDHYTNVRASLTRLLGLGVVPILNENDAVTTRELRFGDNDRLAALIAQIDPGRAGGTPWPGTVLRGARGGRDEALHDCSLLSGGNPGERMTVDRALEAQGVTGTLHTPSRRTNSPGKRAKTTVMGRTRKTTGTIWAISRRPPSSMRS